MNCSNCGAALESGAEFCGACGQRVAGAPGTAAGWPATTRASVAYAGFWLRLAAYLIDNVLLGFVLGNLLLRPLMGRPGGIPADDPWYIFTNSSPQITALMLLFLMGNWVYYAVSESSVWQATIGKKVLGLVVTDLNGNRISFGRASARFFAKILSSMTLLVGFVMAGFTQRKQALHDLVAGCLVMKKV